MALFRVAAAVAGKEIRAGLRDRQALVYTVLLPLALYPVLFWVMLQGFLVMQGERERTEVTVGAAADLAPELIEALRAALEAPGEDLPPGPARLELGDYDRGAAEAALWAGELDAALVAAEDGPVLLYDGSKSRSSLALDRGLERLGAAAQEARVRAVGGEADRLVPFRVEAVDLASGAESSAFVLSFLLPMMFCIMAVLGAFFPAIDLTAGESERGTLETTLLLPVPRLGVLLGKVAAVTTFASLATVLNLVGLLVAAEHLLAGLGADAFEFEVPWGVFPKAAPLLLLFLITTSAVLLGVASLARTFKQGQALLGSVQMVLLVPAMVVSMPGIDLSPGLALVPVAQTALAFKALLQSEAGALELLLVTASQILYGALALALALRLAASEALRGGGDERVGLFEALRARGSLR